MTEQPRSAFEEQLATYFPELVELFKVVKIDPKMKIVIETLIEMRKRRHYGKLEISYQDGKINHVLQTISKK